MLGKFKFIFHICAMKETLDFFIVKVRLKKLRGAVKLPFFHNKMLEIGRAHV